MRILTSLLALCACALPAVADEPSPEDWQISRQESSRKVEPGTAVTVVNPYGDLRVRAGADDEVYLLAVIQRHRDDPRQAQVTTDASEGATRVEVRYPEPPGGVPEAIPETWTRRRVDLTVYVPAEAATSARTGAGLLELKGLAGDVEAVAERGDLRIRTSGGVRARTEHGEIFAQLRRTDWSGTSQLETLTGDIRVELPRGGEADVKLETRGEITTDYSIDIDRPGGSQLKRGTAKIGEAGGRLVLKSNAGAIRLLESSVPEQTPPAPTQNSSQLSTHTALAP